MISVWLEGQPERVKAFLEPDWTYVRAAVALASRNEQACLASLDAFVVSERESTLETLAMAGHRIAILLEAVWPEGVPGDLADACPCQSELDLIGGEHFQECPYLDPNYDPPFEEFDCDTVEEVAS